MAQSGMQSRKGEDGSTRRTQQLPLSLGFLLEHMRNLASICFRGVDLPCLEMDIAMTA